MAAKPCIWMAMAAGLGIVSPAFAQQDDWEFQEDPARRISVAAVRYDAGQTIIVQCREGALTTVLIGMPQSTEAMVLTASRADGRSVSQTWSPAGAPGAYLSAVPGRDVRFMRGGGAYSLRTTEGATRPFRGEFDLPAQSTNLDRVLTGCGWAATDDRDALAAADDLVSLVNPDAQRRRPPRSSRSVAGRPRAPEPPQPSGPPVPPPAEQIVSCIVRDLRLRECRADHPASAQDPSVILTIRINEGREVYPVEGSDAASSEGKVIRVTGGRMLVVVDYIAALPAR